MLQKYKTDAKRTYQVMKEIIGKQKKNQISSPKKLKLIKPLYKVQKILLRNSTNFLVLFDQNWQKNPQH